MTESLLAQVRKRGSFVPIFWSESTLMMTALSCCLNVSFDVPADGAVVVAAEALFFFEGVRLVVRPVAPLANNLGDLRKWASRSRDCRAFFRGVRTSVVVAVAAVVVAAAAADKGVGWRLRVDIWNVVEVPNDQGLHQAAEAVSVGTHLSWYSARCFSIFSSSTFKL